MAVMVAAFVMENAGLAATTAISIITEKAEDWKQVVPEAHDFHRECLHFLNIIEALKLTPGAVEEKPDKKALPRNLSVVVKVMEASAKFKRFGKKVQHGATDEETRPLNINNNSSSNNITNGDASSTNGGYGAVSQQSTQQQSTEETPGTTNTSQTTEGTTVAKDASKIKKKKPRGAQGLVIEITEHIEKSQKRLDKFIKEHERKKSWYNRVRWAFRRAIIAKEHRDFIKEESNIIRHLLNDLVLCQKLAESSKTPTIENFESDMTEEPYFFWKKHIGHNIVGDWNIFLDAYNLLYGKLGQSDLAYVERTLKSRTCNQVTIYSFISFNRKHGFPFQKNISTSVPATEEPVLSEEARMEITKMVMKMVTDFSKPEMQQHLLALYGWYKGLKRDDVGGYQERAYEWARLVKETRSIEDEESWSEQQKKAVAVDKARRELSFFYQKYMVMWRVGQISREALKDVDFPGKARIKDFLRTCKPLDRANFKVIIGKDDKDWDIKGKPKVYRFLELIILDDEKKRKDKSPGTASSNNVIASTSSRKPIQQHSSTAEEVDLLDVSHNRRPVL